MLPPMLLYLRVHKPGGSAPGIWLPLFLVWLLVLPIVVLVLSLTVIADLVLLLAGQSYHHYTLLLLGFFELLGATRGSVVSVRAKEDVVDIRFA